MSDVNLVGRDEMTEEKVIGDIPGGSGETQAASTVRRLAAHSPQPVATPASLDTRAFRRTMGLFATGVTVITTRVNGDIHGMTASSVAPVSLDPLLVLVSIARRTRMYDIIHRAGKFAINILSEHQEELSRHFAGAGTSLRPASLRFESGPDDSAPFIHDTLAAIRCRIEREVDVGDHVVVLGRVIQFHEGSPAPPLIYFGSRYCSVRELEAPGVPVLNQRVRS